MFCQTLTTAIDGQLQGDPPVVIRHTVSDGEESDIEIFEYKQRPTKKQKVNGWVGDQPEEIVLKQEVAAQRPAIKPVVKRIDIQIDEQIEQVDSELDGDMEDTGEASKPLGGVAMMDRSIVRVIDQSVKNNANKSVNGHIAELNGALRTANSSSSSGTSSKLVGSLEDTGLAAPDSHDAVDSTSRRIDLSKIGPPVEESDHPAAAHKMLLRSSVNSASSSSLNKHNSSRQSVTSSMSGKAIKQQRKRRRKRKVITLRGVIENSSNSTTSPIRFRCLTCNTTFTAGSHLTSHQCHPPPYRQSSHTPQSTFDTLPSPSSSYSSSTTPSPPSSGSSTPPSPPFPSFQQTPTDAPPPSSTLSVPPSQKRQRTEICRLCGKVYGSSSALMYHERRHHFEHLREQCDQCERKFRTAIQVERHQRRGCSLACDVCNTRSTDLQEFIAHQKKHARRRPNGLTPARGDPVKCEVCGKTFSHQSYLSRHHLSGKCRALKCDDCGVNFDSVGKLKSHVRQHSIAEPFKCRYCKKGFSGKDALWNHEQDHVGESNPYECRKCTARFETNTVLRLHVKAVHSRDKHEQCPHCGKLLTKSYMKEHMRLHTGVRPYACDQCDKKFTGQTALRKHKKLHTGEISCGICGKIFSQKSHLRTHLQVHDGMVV